MIIVEGNLFLVDEVGRPWAEEALALQQSLDAELIGGLLKKLSGSMAGSPAFRQFRK